MKKDIRISIILVSVAILYTIGWFVLATRAQNAIDDLIETQKANGVEITSAARSKTGFPFSIKLRLTDFAAKTNTGLTLQAPVLIAGVSLSDIHHVTIDAGSGLSLSLAAGKTRRPITAASESANGSFGFTDSDITASDLILSAVTMGGLIDSDAPLSAATVSLHVDRPSTPPADHTQAGDHAIVNATMVLVPGAQIPALGNNIKRLTIDATIMGNLPALDQAALTAWSTDGGTIEIHEASTDWGPLGLGLDGTLAFDPDLQPIASFNAKITGFTPTLDALAITHVVKPSTAALASVGLGLLAQPEGPDNVPTVTVPITIQNGLLYLSSFKLMRLPPLELY